MDGGSPSWMSHSQGRSWVARRCQEEAIGWGINNAIYGGGYRFIGLIGPGTSLPPKGLGLGLYRALLASEVAPEVRRTVPPTQYSLPLTFSASKKEKFMCVTGLLWLIVDFDLWV